MISSRQTHSSMNDITYPTVERERAGLGAVLTIRVRIVARVGVRAAYWLQANAAHSKRADYLLSRAIAQSTRAHTHARTHAHNTHTHTHTHAHTRTHTHTHLHFAGRTRPPGSHPAVREKLQIYCKRIGLVVREGAVLC